MVQVENNSTTALKRRKHMLFMGSFPSNKILLNFMYWLNFPLSSSVFMIVGNNICISSMKASMFVSSALGWQFVSHVSDILSLYSLILTGVFTGFYVSFSNRWQSRHLSLAIPFQTYSQKMGLFLHVVVYYTNAYL